VGSLPRSLSGKKTATVAFRASSIPQFFLSRDQLRDRSDRKLSAKVRLNHGKGKARLTLPRRLGPGAYFVLACPQSGHGRCAASKSPGIKPLPRPGTPGAPSAPPPASPTLEPGAAATATIGKSGGTLRATGANGVRYTLTINPGSLAQDTSITMTPLSKLTGGDFRDAFVGGVQFAPEGLLLVKGAMLTIAPPRRVPVRRQVALGYDGGGSGLHVVPIAPSRKQIQIPIVHFSGVGVGSSPDGSGPTGEPPPSDNSGFYGQLISELLGELRDGQISQDDFNSTAASVLNDYLRDINSEEVPPGLNDDDAAQTAIRDLLGWARLEALVLGKVDELPDVTPTIMKLLEGVYKRAQQRCAAHDLSQIPRILTTDRTEILVSGNEHHTFAEDLKCLRFKISFDSSIQDVGGNFDGEFDTEVVSNPTVQLDLPTLLLTGSAPITYTTAQGSKTQSFSCPGGGGSYDETDTMIGSQSSTLNVLKMTLPDYTTLADPNADHTIQLVIDPGLPEEKLDINKTGPDCPSDQTALEPFWYSDFFSTPLQGASAEPFNDTFVMVFTLTLTNGSEDIADAGFTGFASADNGNAVTETTTIDVKHTPPAP
jgi:hypothetical protein